MNLPILLKYLAGAVGLALWAWLAFLKLTPVEPLVDLLKMGVGGLIVHMLQGGSAPFVSGAPSTAAAPPAGGQSGFIGLRLLAVIASIALGLAMLAGCAAPNASQVDAIKSACAIDAGIRPTVTILLAVPGLAKPEEIAAVAAARTVIDPVCANPAGTAQENALAAVSGASATLIGIVTQMQMRKAEGAK